MSQQAPGAIVIFSTADWATRYWTNKQHIAKRLAERGCSVLYIETVGLRAPAIGRVDIARILRRLASAVTSPRKVADRLWVASPLTIPFGHRFGVIREFNRWRLSASLRSWLKKLEFNRPVFWTYHPFMMTAISGIDHAALVYHCVDELAAVPRIDAQVMEAEERKLLSAADLVFATSPALAEKCAGFSSRSHYLPNVADIGLFLRARCSAALPADLAAIEQPRLGYAGVLSDFKLDFQLLLKLAKSMPHWQLVFIGEEREGQADPVVQQLRGLANVHFLGWREHRLLPDYFRGLDVGLLPLCSNAYTRAVFPMKFFEYLAAGLPIVATNLPALHEYRHLHLEATDEAGFTAAIKIVLANRVDHVVPADHPVLYEQDWERQLDKMIALLGSIERERDVLS